VFHELTNHLWNLTCGQLDWIDANVENETLEQQYQRELVTVATVAARCAEIMCDLAALAVEESKLLGDKAHNEVKQAYDRTCTELDAVQLSQ
jgi:galactokinase